VKAPGACVRRKPADGRCARAAKPGGKKGPRAERSGNGKRQKEGEPREEARQLVSASEQKAPIGLNNGQPR